MQGKYPTPSAVSLVPKFIFSPFQAVKEIANMQTEQQLSSLSGRIECEVPNCHLNSFVGTMYLKDKKYNFSLQASTSFF